MTSEVATAGVITYEWHFWWEWEWRMVRMGNSWGMGMGMENGEDGVRVGNGQGMGMRNGEDGDGELHCLYTTDRTLDRILAHQLLYSMHTWYGKGCGCNRCCTDSSYDIIFQCVKSLKRNRIFCIWIQTAESVRGLGSNEVKGHCGSGLRGQIYSVEFYYAVLLEAGNAFPCHGDVA